MPSRSPPVGEDIRRKPLKQPEFDMAGAALLSSKSLARLFAPSPSAVPQADPEQERFRPVAPWPRPDRAACDFYTCATFPDGETVDDANWDLRGHFESYVGHYPLAGKTVLDVGTASGFLAFSAEAAGATVTAVDALHARELERIPFAGSAFTDRRHKWIESSELYLNALKRSFWYSWYKRSSGVEVVYTPASDLWRWKRRFDVVIAGAIVEHLSDPVPFLASLTRLAREAVIVAFTPVVDTEELRMEPMNGWDNPRFHYSWWRLSLGLYRRVFQNMGFSLEVTEAEALCNEYRPPLRVRHPTLIARRLPG